jgi:hypothetical protein
MTNKSAHYNARLKKSPYDPNGILKWTRHVIPCTYALVRLRKFCYPAE